MKSPLKGLLPVLYIIHGLSLFIACQAQDRQQGFFLNDFKPKSASIPAAFIEYAKPAAAAGISITVNGSNRITPVSKYIFGNNANIWMTRAVDQPLLLENIKKLSPNVLRFPGGNLSSLYFWNSEKNQPPADAPAQLLDANGSAKPAEYWFGKNPDFVSMSVDDYYSMLQQTNNTGMITVNYGYARYSTAADPVAAAAHLAAEWVRYDRGRTKYWEVGNESNGTWQAGYRIKTADNKGGQPEIIQGDLYGMHFRVFADSMRKAARELGTEIFIGAQLMEKPIIHWWNSTDRDWNAGVFKQAADVPDFYIVHSYYTPYQRNSTAAEILASADKVTTDMMEYLIKSQQEAGVKPKPVALTEWNIFAEGSKQQASYINGMHATIVLGELIRNKFGMAARWNLANKWDNGNDHGTFSTFDEPGRFPKWNPRAVFYYMYYFQKYFGDYLLDSSVKGNDQVLAYASSFDSGEIGLVVINKDTTAQAVNINVNNWHPGNRFYMHTLTGGSGNGEFSLKVSVNGQAATYNSGGPEHFETIQPWSAPVGDGVRFIAPARSVQYILVEQKK